MHMKAAVLRTQGSPRPYATSQPMTIETVQLDPPGPGEVLYEIVGAGRNCQRAGGTAWL